MIQYSKRILVLMILVGMIACEKAVEWDFSPGVNDRLVVDALITDEFKKQEVRLSLSYDELNGLPVPVNDAQVKVIQGSEEYRFVASPIEPGLYLSDYEFAAVLNRPYQLEVLYNQERYEAQNQMVEVMDFVPVSYALSGDTNFYHITNEPDLFTPLEDAFYSVAIDWRHLENTDSAQAKLYYYSFRSVDVSELLRPQRETVHFPKGSIITQTKYSLNPDFAAYYRAVLLETEWQGGLFDEASGNVPTNLSNNALGFFGVSAVISKQFVAE